MQRFQERLMADLKAAIDATKDFADKTLRQSGDNACAITSERLAQALQQARIQLEHVEQTLTATAKDTAFAANQYVRSNPWKAVGIGAALGVVIGLLAGRR
jgi:ElaB/YqjD/DUF883 family membrane-anchored ribosome-binding protein